MTTDRPLCTHGYVMMQDPCPGCDAMQETPHEAVTVHVTPRWSNRAHIRCVHCQRVASNRIHTASETTP